MKENNNIVAIIGAGPAGLSAAIYLERANIKTLIFDGDAPGGKMVKTAHIENYPSHKFINGADLSYSMFEQATNLGTNFIGEYVQTIKKEGEKFIVVTNSKKEYEANAIFLANGTENKKLNIPGEETFFNKGVSYCAVCDSSFFKNQDIAVVGSGNSACEETIYLSNIGKNIHLFVRGDKLKCDEIIVKELITLKNVTIHYNSRILEILGNQKVEKIKIINDATKQESEMEIAAVFPFIGLKPIVVNVEGDEMIKRDVNNFIIVNQNMRTNVKGVYAIGDVTQKRYRQITTAVNDGTIAALNAVDFLKNKIW